MNGDREVAESVLTTAGAPARLRLTPDRAAIAADGQDLSFVTVEAVDAEGRPQPNADQEVQFALTVRARLRPWATATGRATSRTRARARKLFNGRALVVVRAGRERPGRSR